MTPRSFAHHPARCARRSLASVRYGWAPHLPHKHPALFGRCAPRHLARRPQRFAGQTRAPPSRAKCRDHFLSYQGWRLRSLRSPNSPLAGGSWRPHGLRVDASPAWRRSGGLHGPFPARPWPSTMRGHGRTRRRTELAADVNCVVGPRRATTQKWPRAWPGLACWRTSSGEKDDRLCSCPSSNCGHGNRTEPRTGPSAGPA